MGLVRSFIGTDGIWQYIPHINTGLFSIIKVHFLLFANLIVDWHINTINFTDSGNFFKCIECLLPQRGPVHQKQCPMETPSL